MPCSGADERARTAVPWRSRSDLDMARTLSHLTAGAAPPENLTRVRLCACMRLTSLVCSSAFEYVCLFFPWPLSSLLASLSLIVVMEYVAVLVRCSCMSSRSACVSLLACTLNVPASNPRKAQLAPQSIEISLHCTRNTRSVHKYMTLRTNYLIL